jgi:predicted nucleic acid-binding protein
MNVMTDKIFIDSNIWCYLFINDEYEKYKIVEQFISEKASDSIFVISYQVINEVTNKLIQKKLKDEITKENIQYMYRICMVQDFSRDIIMLAFNLREKYSLSFWDSIIVASALNSNCNILASEDMQNGLKINNMIINNIFNKNIKTPYRT